MSSWLLKYKCEDLEDYDNNQNQINKIIKLISDGVQSFIIKGDSGVGKNNIINLISKKNNYKVKSYKINDKKIITLNNFYLNNIGKKKTILIINKLDYITTINEKKSIQELNKLANSKSNNIILIFLVEKIITKIVKEINKNSELIELNKPSNKLLNNLIDKINKAENIKINKYLYDNIINLSQQDIRRLVLILKDLKISFNDEVIEKNNYNEFLKFTSYKEKNYNINDTTELIINNFNYDFCEKYYNSEKVILPLMIYENFILKLQKKEKDNNILEIMKKISNLISLGDIIETNIYTDQNWYLQSIHGFITIISTSYFINNFDKNKYKLKINFSNDLNKTSLKNINKKNYTNIKYIINKSTEEILIINYLFNSYLRENKIDQIVNYMKYYNINFKLLNVIFKINKLNKVAINSVQKKLINSYFN